jgi:hypothetical protein
MNNQNPEPLAETSVSSLIAEVVPPPLVVSETAVRQLRPLLEELIRRRAETSVSSPERDKELAFLIQAIVRDVAELEDRNSPNNWPEAMIVTDKELWAILENRLSRLSREESATQWVKIKEGCEMPKDRQVVRVYGSGYQEVVVYRRRSPIHASWETHHGSAVHEPEYWKALDYPFASLSSATQPTESTEDWNAAIEAASLVLCYACHNNKLDPSPSYHSPPELVGGKWVHKTGGTPVTCVATGVRKLLKPIAPKGGS